MIKTITRVAVSFLLALGLTTPCQALEVRDLMGWLATTQEGRATFVEERFVGGFDNALITSGELYFKAPNIFERRTLKPSTESMLVNGNAMVLQRGSQKRSMNLDAVPEAAAIVGAVRGTLTGDASALDKHFRLGLTGKPEQWLLDLLPRDEQLAANVRTIQMRGTRGVVTSVEVWFASGDRSAMKITPLAVK
jgi:outer membrane lipoprotein-sorting protein